MIKEPGKKPLTPIINPNNSLELKEIVYITIPYVPGLSEELRKIFKHTSVQVIYKGGHIFKCILMHPKDIIPSQLKQNIAQNGPVQKKTATFLT